METNNNKFYSFMETDHNLRNKVLCFIKKNPHLEDQYEDIVQNCYLLFLELLNKEENDCKVNINKNFDNIIDLYLENYNNKVLKLYNQQLSLQSLYNVQYEEKGFYNIEYSLSSDSIFRMANLTHKELQALVYYNEMSDEEIAAMQGVSPNAVYKARKRGIQKCAKIGNRLYR